MGLEIEDKWFAFILEIVQFPWAKKLDWEIKVLDTSVNTDHQIIINYHIPG